TTPARYAQCPSVSSIGGSPFPPRQAAEVLSSPRWPLPRRRLYTVSEGPTRGSRARTPPRRPRRLSHAGTPCPAARRGAYRGPVPSAGRLLALAGPPLDLLEDAAQVLADRVARGVRVAGRDGLPDAPVLVPAERAPLLEQQREHHLGAVAERPHDLVEVAVAGDPLDLDVEAPVALGGADLVPALGGGDALGDPPVDRREVGLGGALGGQGDRKSTRLNSSHVKI